MARSVSALIEASLAPAQEASNAPACNRAPVPLATPRSAAYSHLTEWEMPRRSSSAMTSEARTACSIR